MWAWILKFISGFNIFGANQGEPGKRLGKILFVSVLVLAGCLLTYKVLEKKISKVEKYINCNVTQVHPTKCPEEPAFVLLKLWRLRLFSVR